MLGRRRHGYGGVSTRTTLYGSDEGFPHPLAMIFKRKIVESDTLPSIAHAEGGCEGELVAARRELASLHAKAKADAQAGRAALQEASAAIEAVAMDAAREIGARDVQMTRIWACLQKAKATVKQQRSQLNMLSHEVKVIAVLRHQVETTGGLLAASEDARKEEEARADRLAVSNAALRSEILALQEDRSWRAAFEEAAWQNEEHERTIASLREELGRAKSSAACGSSSLASGSCSSTGEESGDLSNASAESSGYYWDMEIEGDPYVCDELEPYVTEEEDETREKAVKVQTSDEIGTGTFVGSGGGGGSGGG